MPIGDVGGHKPTLIISCVAMRKIKQGQPVVHLFDYKVTNSDLFSRPQKLFGQAMETVEKGDIFPVTVRGLISFRGELKGLWRIGDQGLVQDNKVLYEDPSILYWNDEGRIDVLL